MLTPQEHTKTTDFNCQFAGVNYNAATLKDFEFKMLLIF